jgi:hypothetical protein
MIKASGLIEELAGGKIALTFEPFAKLFFSIFKR